MVGGQPMPSVGSMGAGRVAKWDRDSTPRIENHMEHGKKIIEYVHIYDDATRMV